MWSIDKLQETWQLASQLHSGQKYSGARTGEDVEYLNHIGSVTFEVLNAIQHSEHINADLAIQCAILHDTIEDTGQSYEGIKTLFGEAVADGVMALSKDDALESKQMQMKDSLHRIKQQPKEVWAVKMADRICNLLSAPHYWSKEKRIAYQVEAKLIHEELQAGNAYLANRLQQKIEAYTDFIQLAA